MSDLEYPLLAPTKKHRDEGCVTGIVRGLWSSGNFIITLAAIVCSAIALFIKQLHGSVPAVQITLISSCISWLLTTAWLLLVGEELRSLVRRQVPLLVLRGALGAATSILYYQSIQMLRMNEAVTVFFTNPAMAALLDYLINGKVIRLGTVAGIALAIGGVVLVGCPTCQFAGAFGAMSTTHLLGICYGLGGAAANAGGYIAVHKIGADVPFVVLMWWYHTLVTLGSLPCMLLALPLADVVLPSWQQAGWIAAVAAAHFLGQLLLNRGFNLDDATHGSAVFAQQVLWSTLWSVAIMHHNLQLCAGLGSASILIGVVLVTQSSGMDVEEQQLEEQRTLSTLEHRVLSGAASPLAVLARAGSLPGSLWLGHRSSKNSRSVAGMSPTAVGQSSGMTRTFTTEW
ncbi:hypothetical protein OEZ86_000580 [Tetradesmus obliquus]|nr:hypothetical protein OEZ86_000580 [Tetradesmus obliquus]